MTPLGYIKNHLKKRITLDDSLKKLIHVICGKTHQNIVIILQFK